MPGETNTVLPNENQEQFDDLIAEYKRTFAPTGAHEEFLVDQMAQSRWRLARFRRLEAAVIQQMTAAAFSSDTEEVLAAAFLNNTAGPFETLQRYAAAAERSYYRALKQLQAGRKQEKQNEPNSDAPTPQQPSEDSAARLPLGNNHHLHIARKTDDSLDEVASEQRTPIALTRPR
jgi:hypothetical protein